jgi:hypothetical protein
VSSNDGFDLIVIGCGPAAEKGGAQAAYFGKRVAVIERHEHMNTGTVPSKTLHESALYVSGLKQRGLYGIDYSLKENLIVHDFMHRECEVVDIERHRDSAVDESGERLAVFGCRGARPLNRAEMRSLCIHPRTGDPRSVKGDAREQPRSAASSSSTLLTSFLPCSEFAEFVAMRSSP